MSSNCQPSLPTSSSSMAEVPCHPSRSEPILPRATEGDTSKAYPFSEGEYNKGVAALKNNKAAGRDDIRVEQLKHFGPKAHKWLLIMLNICFMENKIPTIWRKIQDYRHIETREGTLRFQRTTDLYPSYVTRTNSTKE